MSHIHGRFAWFDLMTPDVEAAKAFYTETIGWRTGLWNGGDAPMPYTMIQVGEQAIGGIAKLPKMAQDAGAPPHWLAYVAVDDVDASADLVSELGGTVLSPPMDIPNVGRFAIFADPQGAVMALFHPDGDLPGQDQGPGFFCWADLVTSDPESAWNFYHRLFGWKQTDAMDTGDMGTYQMFAMPDAEMSRGGYLQKPEAMPASAWLHYVTVDNLDDALTRLQRLGGTVIREPHEVPGGDRIAQVLDPQGGAFALHCVGSPATAP